MHERAAIQTGEYTFASSSPESSPDREVAPSLPSFFLAPFPGFDVVCSFNACAQDAAHLLALASGAKEAVEWDSIRQMPSALMSVKEFQKQLKPAMACETGAFTTLPRLTRVATQCLNWHHDATISLSLSLSLAHSPRGRG